MSEQSFIHAALLAACGGLACVTVVEIPVSSGDEAGSEDSGGALSAPVLELSLGQVKQFQFSWDPVPGADHYQMLESVAGGDYQLLADDISEHTLRVAVPLHLRHGARYKLRACAGVDDLADCSESAPVEADGTLVEAIGFFKAPDPVAGEWLGWQVALSSDGATLAAAAPHANGGRGAVHVYVRDGDGDWAHDGVIFGHESDAAFASSLALAGDGSRIVIGARTEPVPDPESGAAYVFHRGASEWTQEARLAGPETNAGDWFGAAVTMSTAGDTIAVAAPKDADAGSVHIFTRDGESWLAADMVNVPSMHWDDALALAADGQTLAVGTQNQRVHLFARVDTGWSPQPMLAIQGAGTGLFAWGVTLSADGTTIAVSDPWDDDGGKDSGVVHVFDRAGTSWSSATIIKAPVPDGGDLFGSRVRLSDDGDLLFVGAIYEDSDAQGIDGDMLDDFGSNHGAIFVLARSEGGWQHRSYVKSKKNHIDTVLGKSIAISGDGMTLAAGSFCEPSTTPGVGGEPLDKLAPEAGAVYLY